MATAVFIHDGDAIDYTPAADMASGDVLVQGELVAVAKRPIPAGTPGALSVTGVFDFPKAIGAGTAIAVGVDVYWDPAVRLATADPAGGANKRIGRSVAAANDNAPTVRVRLSQ